MIILGIHAGQHEASATLFDDYRILGAVQMERLNRIKGAGVLPDEWAWPCVDEVLSMHGLTRRDVEAVALTREEAQLFIGAVDVHFQLFFLTLLRTGMRWGEAAALRWGDIQFGSSEEDQNRFIWVRRNWVQGKFTSPKSKKTRRISGARTA